MTDVLFLYPNLEYVAELRLEIAGICTNLDGSKREMEGTCLALKKKEKKKDLSGGVEAGMRQNIQTFLRTKEAGFACLVQSALPLVRMW